MWPQWWSFQDKGQLLKNISLIWLSITFEWDVASWDYISAAQLKLIAHSLSQPVLVWSSADLTLPVRQFSIYSAPNLQYIQSITSTQPVKISSLTEVTLTQTVNISSLHRSTDVPTPFHRLATIALILVNPTVCRVDASAERLSTVSSPFLS